MKRKDLHINHVSDMYTHYIETEVRNNPEVYFLRHDTVLRTKGIKVLMAHTKKGEEVVMTYTLFRSILEKCNKLIAKIVNSAEPFYLGNSLGHIQGDRIPRNFKKKVVDHGATRKYREASGNEDAVVYFTNDSYCRIAWKKLKSLRNSSDYELAPAKFFKNGFSEALIANPMLELLFSLQKHSN